jgi:MFS family permease
MSMVAYPLVALALTGSPTKAGLVGTFALLGQMVFRLPAGALVDRHDRRRMMLVADALRGVVILGVAVALVVGALGLPLLVVAAFVENATGEFFRPASTAAVRRVIDPAQMPEAVSKSEARSYGATIAGPPLGGLLYGVARYLPFAADAASYIYSSSRRFSCERRCSLSLRLRLNLSESSPSSPVESGGSGTTYSSAA